MGRAIIGQERVIEHLLIALLADGNVLVEGLPGVAKTRAVKALAKNLDAAFRHIQFTPGLLPTDVVGSEVYEAKSGVFRFEAGPVLGNLVLVDEINRAPAKVQSALLEAMEERQVTVAGTTHGLPPLFMVMATQNPSEQEGTYPLPEAQLDRFLMHAKVDYPSDQDERIIAHRQADRPWPPCSEDCAEPGDGQRGWGSDAGTETRIPGRSDGGRAAGRHRPAHPRNCPQA